MCRKERGQRVDRGVVERDLDALSDAVAKQDAPGHRDRRRGIKPGREFQRRDAERRGWAVGKSGGVHESGHRFDGRRVGGVAGERAAASERGDVANDRAGSERLGDGRREFIGVAADHRDMAALQEHVHRRDGIGVGILLGIEQNAVLARGRQRAIGPLALPGRGKRLDHQHRGAEIRKLAAAAAHGDAATRFDDAQPGERPIAIGRCCGRRRFRGIASQLAPPRNSRHATALRMNIGRARPVIR